MLFKTKTLLITAAFLFIHSFPISSQEFAPIGAKWIFPEYFAFSPNKSLITFKSQGETTIDGLLYKQVSKSKWSCNLRFRGTILLHQRQDSIFLRRPTGELELIIDFGAQIGDSWIVSKYSETDFADSIRCTVDSLSHITINNTELKVLNVSLSYFNDFGIQSEVFKTRIIEKIGFERALVPINDPGVCDGNFEDDIRCYQDHTGVFNFSQLDCLYTSTSELSWIDIKIYPNPTTHTVYIENTDDEAELSLVNKNGQLQHINCEEQSLDLSSLSTGLYYLRYQRGSNVGIKSIIKL